MDPVQTTELTEDAWNAAASKTRVVQRAGLNPKRTLYSIADGVVTLTEYDEDIETVDTGAGTATVSPLAWADARDKDHLIRRLGLPVGSATRFDTNEDGTIGLRPPTEAELADEQLQAILSPEDYASIGGDLNSCYTVAASGPYDQGAVETLCATAYS